MALFNKSNFTTWAVHNKSCKGSVDPELPQVETGAAVPAEYTLNVNMTSQ